MPVGLPQNKPGDTDALAICVCARERSEHGEICLFFFKGIIHIGWNLERCVCFPSRFASPNISYQIITIIGGSRGWGCMFWSFY